MIRGPALCHTVAKTATVGLESQHAWNCQPLRVRAAMRAVKLRFECTIRADTDTTLGGYGTTTYHAVNTHTFFAQL